VPFGETAVDLPVAGDRASTIFGFDTGGDPDLLSSSELAAFILSPLVTLLGPAFKGDPGSSVESIGTFTSAVAGTTDIPAGTARVRTSGFLADADGGAAYYAETSAIDIFRHATRDGTTPTQLTKMRRTDDLTVGMAVEGEGIPGGTTILSIDSSTTITLSAASTYSPTTIIRFIDRAVDASYEALYPERVFQSLDLRWWHLSREQIISPEMFGPDGVDDYDALLAMVNFINSAGGGHVRCHPRKTYTVGHITAANGRDVLRFNGLDGFIFDLNGAKFDFDGNFDRDASTTTGLGFRIDSSRNFIVMNGELDGNVEQTTNSSGSGETNKATGLRIGGCENYLIENIYAHHFATDGLTNEHDADTYSYFTDATDYNRRASKRGVFRNCQSRFNGRVAFLANSAEMIMSFNCDYTDTAQFTGTYGTGGTLGHAPKVGFDFEPTENKSVQDTLDIDPNNIHFYNCRFLNNFGGDWRANNENATRDLIFEKCRLVAAANSTVTDGTIVGIPGVIIRDCYIDSGNIRFQLNGGTGLATHIFEGNEFRASGLTVAGLHLNGVSASTRICKNRFIGTAAAPAANRIIDTNNTPTTAVFEDNEIFLPAAGYVDGGANDDDNAISLGSIRRSARNRFTTDLLAAAGSSGTAHFHVAYGTTTEVLDDQFVGVAPGTADTFRPDSGSSFDTRFRFNKNRHGYPGVPGKKSLTDAAATFQHGRDANHLELVAPLTADRAVSLNTADATEGAELVVTRTAASTGAFNLNVGTGPLKALATGQWARFRYSGAAWVLTSFGSL
jgi:hypothetical protein